MRPVRAMMPVLALTLTLTVPLALAMTLALAWVVRSVRSPMGSVMAAHGEGPSIGKAPGGRKTKRITSRPESTA